MKRIFLLFLLLPFFSFAAGTDLPDNDDHCEYECRIEPQQGVENSWVVVCDYHNCDIDEQEYMSQSACSNLVSEINDLLDRLESGLEQVDNEVGDVDISLEELKNSLEHYQSYVLSLADTDEEYQQVIGIWGLFLENVATNRQQIAETRGQIDMMMSSISSARDSVGNYDCSGTCSATSSPTNGAGSAACPCQSELSDIINLISTGNQTREHLEDIQREMRAEVKLLSETATNIYDAVDWIKKRLESPDDRMWGEIFDLYRTTFGTNGMLNRASLDLDEIFHDIRQLIRGEVSTPLNLTTEGAIGLNGLVFQMGQFALGQSLSLQMDYMLNTLTNVFSRFFLDYINEVKKINPLQFVPGSRWASVYNSVTNTSLTAQSRYNALANSGGITNWFQRMEIYQQAALGWFDTPLDNPLDYNQEQVENNTIEYAFKNQTNKLGNVVSGLHDATSGVSVLVQEVSDGLREVRLNVRLPSEVILIDTIDLGIVEFPAIAFETSGAFNDFYEVCRSSTSLFWRLGIWAFYLLLAYAIIRVTTKCVLYAVKFFRDL